MSDPREAMDEFRLGPNSDGTPRYFPPGSYGLVVLEDPKGGYRKVEVTPNDGSGNVILYQAVPPQE